MITTLDYGKQLASNDKLSGDCRHEVSEDVKHLDERWKGLLKLSQDEYARYKCFQVNHAYEIVREYTMIKLCFAFCETFFE